MDASWMDASWMDARWMDARWTAGTADSDGWWIKAV
jgi:hypothetical protein